MATTHPTTAAKGKTRILKAFQFYDETGAPLLLVLAPDCWQALSILQKKLQKPFDYNPSFRQLKGK